MAPQEVDDRVAAWLDELSKQAEPPWTDAAPDGSENEQETGP